MIPPPPTSTAATCANCGAGRGGEVGLTGDGRRIKGEVVLRTQDSSGWGVCACREGGQETARAPSCWGYTSPAHAHGIRRARRLGMETPAGEALACLLATCFTPSPTKTFFPDLEKFRQRLETPLFSHCHGAQARWMQSALPIWGWPLPQLLELLSQARA